MADETSSELEIELGSTEVDIQPGGAPVEVPLVIRNVSRIVEQYTIAVFGLDPAWASHPTQTVGLFPGDSDHQVVTFHVPADPALKAARYQFGVVVRSRTSGVERRADGVVVIAGEAAYQLDLAPRRQAVGGRARYRIQLTNIGTADGELDLDAVDAEAGLDFRFLQEQRPRVPTNTTVEVPLDVTPRRRPWVGPPHPYEFTVTARQPDTRADVRSVSGQLVYHPRIASLGFLRPIFMAIGAAVAILVALVVVPASARCALVGNNGSIPVLGRGCAAPELAVTGDPAVGAAASPNPRAAGAPTSTVVAAAGGGGGGAGAVASPAAGADGPSAVMGGGGGPAGAGMNTEGVPTPVPPAATAAAVFMAGVDATQVAAATAVATATPPAPGTATPPAAVGKPSAVVAAAPSAIVPTVPPPTPTPVRALFAAGTCSPPQRPANRPTPAPVKPAASASPAARAPANDWAQSDPTAWWYCFGVTSDQLTQALKANQARLIDVQVEMAQPTLLFSAVMVANQNAYARDWWWYFGLDDVQVQERFTTNNARPIALSAYDAGGGHTRYAVVMVSNKAPDQKAFWWFPDLATAQQVDHLLTVNKARLTEIDPFTDGGERRLAAVMITNSGADQANSTWLDNVATDQISATVTRLNGHVIDIQPGDARGTTFSAIVEACPCAKNWWAAGLDEAGLANTLAQTGGRITSMATYLVDNQRRFAVTLIDNP